MLFKNTFEEDYEMDLITSEQKAQEELEKGYDKAEKILKDEDKLERLLQRLEKS